MYLYVDVACLYIGYFAPKGSVLLLSLGQGDTSSLRQHKKFHGTCTCM